MNCPVFKSNQYRQTNQYRVGCARELMSFDPSTESWEKAAKVAIERAAKTLRDLRVAEIVMQDVQLSDGKVEHYRVKMKVSFKHEG
jgi:flavin-binding protein dodecin